MFAPPRRLAGPALLLVAAAFAVPAGADGPGDNVPDNVRPVPPKGVELSKADRDEIGLELARLQFEVEELADALKGKPALLALLPDVEIYAKAARYAFQYQEIFDAKGIPAVKAVLKAGHDRAAQLKAGDHPWTAQTGYVVRGYRSKIDGSAQPYGLLVPKGYDFAGAGKHRLDFWWHGRGETLSEVNFMANPQSASGIIPAPGAFILYPYGRYCNANKFAGEVDSFECLDHTRKFYRIDDARLVARGFSMGGAACWQYAVHYPTLWCANAPGAGFSETPEFLRVFQKENTDNAPWYEKKLWRMYNATDYAANISNLPTVAYSGEIDSQKQAADIMEKAMAAEGLKLAHVIGPKTGHSYEKGAKDEVNRRIDAIVAKGRTLLPGMMDFTTYTLRYHEAGYVRIDRMGKHWERANIQVAFELDRLAVRATNVSEFTLSFPPGTWPLGARKASIGIDNGKGVSESLDVTPLSDRSLTATFRKLDGKWVIPATPSLPGLAKVHGLQGPIDDAFMDSFVMVSPTCKPLNEAAGQWAAAEMKHAVTHWRQQFRGDAPVKKDTAITDADIKGSNLVLWGDPASNAVLAKIADRLPVKWTADGVVVGDQTYPAGTHVPVLIYPNPLNPAKYVVLNSGFTFREYDYLNNARQVSKLPDYAVLDITTPPNARYPGKVVRAGFFGEKWELLPDDGK